MPSNFPLDGIPVQAEASDFGFFSTQDAGGPNHVFDNTLQGNWVGFEQAC